MTGMVGVSGIYGIRIFLGWDGLGIRKGALVDMGKLSSLLFFSFLSRMID
jgi:hypothetical protein